MTDNVPAEGARVKLGVVPEVIVSAIAAVAAVSAPEVPVIVTVELPAGAVELAVRVSTLDPVVGLVPNEAVTPLGNPEAVRVTLPVNPPASVTVMVAVLLLPWAIDSVDAEEEIVKLGEAVVARGN